MLGRESGRVNKELYRIGMVVKCGMGARRAKGGKLSLLAYLLLVIGLATPPNGGAGNSSL